MKWGVVKSSQLGDNWTAEHHLLDRALPGGPSTHMELDPDAPEPVTCPECGTFHLPEGDTELCPKCDRYFNPPGPHHDTWAESRGER